MTDEIIQRLEKDIESYTDNCVKSYARNINDSEIANVLRDIADRYKPEQ